MKTITISVVSLLMLLCSVIAIPAKAESPEDIIVFVSKDFEIDSVTRDELKSIYLKKKTSWSSKDRIICINAKEDTVLRKAFRASVLQMSMENEKRYWEEQKIKANVSEPPVFSNTVKAVFKVRKIFKAKGAISYAFRKDTKTNIVKTVLVLDKNK
ncbi:MAG: hypothetical protein GY847_17300 [Proteobacteria bacterium]|nr:hypothetical protein [Pseudomonadota bacterium]